MKTGRTYLQFLGLATVAILLFGVFRPAHAAPQEKEKSGATSQKQTSQYVGIDTCKTCHEELYKNNFESTAHFKTTVGDGHGCESCHGPGSAHVEGGGDVTKIISFKSMSKQDANARCLSCHGASHKQQHFSVSAHAGNDVGCLDCHSPHHAKEQEHLLVQAQPGLCYGCHANCEGRFREAVSSPGRRRPHTVQRLPQRPRYDHAPPGEDHAQWGRNLCQVPCRQTGTVRV